MACTSCKVLRFEVDAVKADLSARNEELSILRTAQTECGRMATEIVELQALVDEQRRHMQAQSGQTIDPDVGVVTWLHQMAAKNTETMKQLRQEHDQKMLALQTTHTFQLASLQQHLDTMNTQYATLYDQHTCALERLNAVTAEMQTLESCVAEQRRHLATLIHKNGGGDANVGLLPLVRKGLFESNEDVQRLMEAGVARRTEQLEATFEADLTSVRAACNSLSVALDVTRTEAKQVAAENVALVEQLRKCRDFTEEWKRKYEEMKQCKQDLDALLEANCTANIEATVKEGEEYAEKFQKVVTEKEMVEKARDALLTSVRHWQTEAKNTTDELVTALANRDALHLKLYTVSAEKQQLEDKLERLEKVVESQKVACGFVSDVFELVDKYQTSRKQESSAADLQELEILLLKEEEQEEAQADKKKKKHKRRAKK